MSAVAERTAELVPEYGVRMAACAAREPGARMRETLTTAEIASLFRVHQSTVERWIRDERLAAIRTPGGPYRVDKAEVDALLEGRAPKRDTAA